MIWVTAGVNFDDTIGNAGSNFYNVKGPLDETFAVLDGRTPLVNFTSSYGFLLPYLTALSMSVLGASFGVFSVTLCTITAALAARRLRRPTARHRQRACRAALYLPFLATGFFAEAPGLVESVGDRSRSYALLPLRYGGPYLLAWLHRPPPRRRSPAPTLDAVPRRGARRSEQRRLRPSRIRSDSRRDPVDRRPPAVASHRATPARSPSWACWRHTRSSRLLTLPRTGSLPSARGAVLLRPPLRRQRYALLPTRTFGLRSSST